MNFSQMLSKRPETSGNTGSGCLMVFLDVDYRLQNKAGMKVKVLPLTVDAE
ncbi:hypothetical protein [Pseudomonas sp. RW3S2]|uniref:hypothetical protein n=1 Tax=Pseudomonas sp. RW3S2 TaxID=485884 RepID=UPI001644C6D2|nr:hypothetical protein [Pseudomonas sp. RW3S2]MBC3419233.1 hypothetical protein [Pseudomonas sp. RW3S2]